ncbi:hypothetical protein ACIQYS_09910 [Psychrobacillus sp. NPDC096426]|uniref:hypothetical protein n=1 Tax=Psychrobacillus sp. NPDC096426 TaxID=3364491 RepID=UPI00382BB3E8
MREEYSGIEDNQEYIKSKNEGLDFLDDIKASAYNLDNLDMEFELEDIEEDIKETKGGKDK